jgi:transposase-like protein
VKRKRFTTEQIIKMLKEVALGIKITELRRKHSISEQTFYNWRNKYGVMQFYPSGSGALKLHYTIEFEAKIPLVKL